MRVGQQRVTGVAVFGHDDRVVMSRGVDLWHDGDEAFGRISDDPAVLRLGPETARVHRPSVGADRTLAADRGQAREAVEDEPEALVVTQVQVKDVDLVL